MTATTRLVPPAATRARPLDRALRLFADVQAGEGGTAILLALNVFFIFSAYYVIKPIREALILSGSGAEVKSYAAAGQAVLLLLLVPAYGALADRLPRRGLLNTVTAFFVACLFLFYGLVKGGVPVGVVFFLWVGIFNLMIPAQFWSFANDIYTKDQGERLFAIVVFGGSLGAVVGSAATGRLIPLIGIAQLLLVAAALLVVAVAISNVVDARERARHETHLPPSLTTAELPAATGEYQITMVEDQKKLTVSMPGTGPVNRPGTFRLVFADRYLLMIALLMLILNWVNTTGEYILSRTVAGVARAAVARGTAGGLSEADIIGAFYSDFLFLVSLVSMVLQLFVVSRLIKFFGVRTAILVLPVLALTGYAVLAFVPILALIRTVKIAENATDYSIQNTVRNVLFLPTSRDQKYKAKQAIDSFFVRAGDVLSAALVFVGTTWLSFQTTTFARVNLVLVVAWLLLAVAIGRAYARKSSVIPGPTPSR
ncbi:MAG TPA: Npt1/Npt2 family nucleotide transporter [Gemmatimonadales bacterium]|nr:Npt1/Npt2 family nucleotide transporter [Gemmatimonadales bacterium]